MKKKIGLILEGGGFRGIYSAGILDYFLEKNIEIPYVIGVSMGACNGANYISKQKGRNIEIPYKYINDERYISYKNFLKKGELFGMEFIFEEITNKLNPFDFDTFYNSKQKFIVTATDCKTGKAHYIENFKKYSLSEALKASTSLPYVSKIVKLGEYELLDGGIADPIPYKKALDDGCEKIIVILTQPKGYVKSKMKLQTLGKIIYKDYPKLRETMKNRHINYNNAIKELEKLEENGKAFIIRPKSKLPIARTERDKEKLKKAFELGYTQGKEIINEIKKFCEIE
ncbi:putative patatin/cPLA2 family phospholipase [Hypnocyclicus thermotrophus]|uniref:Patatin/cPLA2 family phospholipase n=1 Tax=Hypnocyclicus thermotrophus TaxID=1627895 RepID=A0AA46I7N4_9FUSO|nr:patatin family protein [Hypnocyclicus thermotrophus]TDT72578.1 putative patatin/cPLA2 family phospholipase [Hypnocyclicus thermotrophus]